MNKINYLFGATVIMTTMILVPPAAMLTSHIVKASTFTSSASAVGVPNQRQALLGMPRSNDHLHQLLTKVVRQGVYLLVDKIRAALQQIMVRQLAQLCHFCCIDK